MHGGGGGGMTGGETSNFPYFFPMVTFSFLATPLSLQSFSKCYVIKLQKLVYHNHRCTPKEEQLPTVNTKLREKGGGGSQDNL